MADIAREFLENSLENEHINLGNIDDNKRIEITPKQLEAESLLSNSSSYVLASNDSQLSRDVDHWLRDSPTEVPRPHGTRVNVDSSAQNSLLSNSFWYLAALVLPLFSNNYPQWRCSPNAILNTAGLVVTQMAHACSRVRFHLRRLTENTLARDVLCTAMDMILVAYAVGFLLLSMYQASLIG